MDPLPVNPKLTIPGEELRWRFARSGGPGGQNVNKVETKVELRWRPAASTALSVEDRDWLLAKLGDRLTADGDLVVTSSRTRDQGRNREDARAKLAQWIERALERPKPRKPTRPPAAAVERRITGKKLRGWRKLARRPAAGEE